MGRLQAESTDYNFGKVKYVLFAAFFVGAGLGVLTTLPRLLASLAAVAGAKPVESVVQDLAINLGVMGLAAYVALDAVETDKERDNIQEEAVLLSSAKVWLRSRDDWSDSSLVQLNDVRAERIREARRPVLLFGDSKFCQDCVNGAAEFDSQLSNSDLLLVPVLNTEETDEAIVKASEKKSYVALPCRVSSEDWGRLCELQEEYCRKQGKDEGAGQVILIKQNGRIATRFLGAPNWAAVAGAA